MTKRTVSSSCPYCGVKNTFNLPSQSDPQVVRCGDLTPRNIVGCYKNYAISFEVRTVIELKEYELVPTGKQHD